MVDFMIPKEIQEKLIRAYKRDPNEARVEAMQIRRKTRGRLSIGEMESFIASYAGRINKFGRASNRIIWSLAALAAMGCSYFGGKAYWNSADARGAEKPAVVQYGGQTRPVEFVVEQPQENQSGLEQKVDKKIEDKNISYTERDVDALARTIVGEAVGELDNRDYLNGFIESVITRAEKKGKSVADIVYEVRTRKVKTKNGEKEIKTWMYSCFDPREGIIQKVNDPVKYVGQERWNKCLEIARKALSSGVEIDNALDGATNYFVSKGDPRINRTKEEAKKYGIPSWAYQKDDDGNFALDKESKRVPVTPLKVVPVKTGNSYFYRFNNF